MCVSTSVCVCVCAVCNSVIEHKCCRCRWTSVCVVCDSACALCVGESVWVCMSVHGGVCPPVSMGVYVRLRVWVLLSTCVSVECAQCWCMWGCWLLFKGLGVFKVPAWW